MNARRGELLIASVGWANILIGLVFVVLGAYVLIGGAEVVAALLQVPKDAGTAGEIVGGAEGGRQAKEAAGLLATGLVGVILALSGVAAFVLILHGLPYLLVGVGVLLRSRVARVFAIIFAIVALVEGLGCLASTGQSQWFIAIGLVLTAYALLSLFALLGKHAAAEFSGRHIQTPAPISELLPGETMPTAPSGRPVPVVALSLLLVAATVVATIFGTLYFTSRPVSPFTQQIDRKGNAAQKAPAIDDTTALAQFKPRLAEFHEAVLAGQIPRAVELLKFVDVDEPDEHGRTALMKAVVKGNLRMTMFLIAMGAQINQRDRDGKTPLFHAVESENGEMVGVLNGGGRTPAEIAALRAQYGDRLALGEAKLRELLAGVMQMPLLNYGIADNRGRTPYMEAILRDRLDIGIFLYAYTPSRDKPVDAQGNSVVHLVAADGNGRLLKKLHFETALSPSRWRIQQPGYLPYDLCEARQTNLAGRLPWMIAAEKGHLDIVKQLLVEPALIDFMDHAGKTGLDLARANGHMEVAAYLTKVSEELRKSTMKID